MTVIESSKKTQDRDVALTEPQVADDDPWASLKAAIARAASVKISSRTDESSRNSPMDRRFLTTIGRRRVNCPTGSQGER
ncbi:hypothetical protein ABID16_004270 [Rhizobium aquaticum]|uniref:Uncharacterized protein n=1 Tax=Rhizobium aquaticum TaxID=1549636 RepID=A0ABV2J5C0_9HYPH